MTSIKPCVFDEPYHAQMWPVYYSMYFLYWFSYAMRCVVKGLDLAACFLASCTVLHIPSNPWWWWWWKMSWFLNWKSALRTGCFFRLCLWGKDNKCAHAYTYTHCRMRFQQEQRTPASLPFLYYFASSAGYISCTGQYSTYFCFQAANHPGTMNKKHV